MRGSAFANGERSVSEIYGTLLIISVVLISALIIVGLGTYAIQNITSDSDDDLARQSVIEIDDSIDELTQGDIEQSTTISVPDDTGADFSVQNETVFIVNATTLTQDWNATYPPKKGGLVDSDKQTNTTTLPVGSIVHEADDGSQVVYQGGAVWEVNDGNVTMVNAPDMDIIDNSLKLALVDVTDMELIQEGGELTIRRDTAGSQQTTNKILETIYSQMKKDGTVQARAKVTITVEGPYAQGWANYAENGMTQPATVNQLGENKYEIEFGTFGNSVTNITADFDDGVIFSEPSEYAPIKYNTSAGNVNELSPGATPSNDTRNYEVVPAGSDYELGIRYNHNDNGYAWWVWNESADKWENIENNSMPMQPTGQIEVVEEDPGNLSSGQFHIQNGTWTCAVNDGSTNSTDVFYKYVDQEDDGCLKNPVDIENPDDHVADLDPNYQIVDSSVTYEIVHNNGTLLGNLSRGDELPKGIEHVNLSFDVNNTGYGTAEQPIAVVANQSKELGDDYWLYTGDENVSISVDSTQNFEYQFNTSKVRPGTYNLSAGTPDDGIGRSNSKWFNVTYRSSDAVFHVNDTTVLNNNVTAGDTTDPIVVEANITNTGETDSQIVALEINSSVVAYKNVTITKDDYNEVELVWNTTKSDANPGGYSGATVETYDDSAAVSTLKVRDPSGNDTKFMIQNVTGATVEEENTATLSARIRNNGSESGTQHVILRDPDTGRTVGKDVSLNAGQTKNVTFDWSTDLGDQGTYNLTVSTYNDDADVVLDVTRETVDADFDLEVVSVDRLVTAGENVRVQVRVYNNGTEADTRQIWLRDFDNRIVNVTGDVTLSPGSSTGIINLTWRTKPEDSDGAMPKNVTIGITQGGEETEEAVTVQDPSADDPVFEVQSINNLNSTPASPIYEGQNLTFDAEIRNTGGQPDRQSIVLLDFDGNPVLVKQDVLINASETKTVSFKWETVVGDAGNGTLNVSTADDSLAFDAVIDPREDKVRSPVDVMFALDETGSMGTSPSDYTFDAALSENGTFTVPDGHVVVAEYESCGWFSCNYYPVEYHIPGDTVNLDDLPASAERWALREPAGGNDPLGERVNATKTALNAMNGTLGDRAGVLEFTTGFNVYQPISNNLNGVENSLRINPGGGTNIAAGISGAEQELLNNANGNKQVMIILTDGIDNRGGDPVQRAKNVDENITIYTVGFAAAEEGVLKAIAQEGSGEGRYIEAENSSELADIFDEIIDEVTEPETPEFEVQNLETNAPIEGGNQLNVTATIHNNATVGGEQAVTLTDFDGNYIDTVVPNISAGGTTNVTLTMDTTGAVDWETNNGSYTDSVSVVTPADDASTGVTLTEPTIPVFTVQNIDYVNDPINETETLRVQAFIENTGDAIGTQTIKLIDNETGDPLNTSVSVQISPGSTEVVNLSYKTIAGQDRTIDEIAVVTEDSSETENVTIRAGDGSGDVNFTIGSLYPDDADVTAGDEVTVYANVTNPGNVTSTDFVTLEYNGSIVDSQKVTLDPGKSQNVSLSWQTQPGDGGTPYPVVSVNATGPGSNSTAVELDSITDPDVEFNITNVNPRDSGVEVGDNLNVTVTVKNIGNETGNRTIVLKDPNTLNPIDTYTVTNLPDGNTATFNLTWADVPDIDEVVVDIPGSTTKTPSVDIDAPNASSQITFSINSVTPSNATSPSDPPTAGNVTLEVEVDIDNRFADGIYVELYTPYGGPVDVQTVSMGNSTKTLRWNTHPAHGADNPQDITVKIRGASASRQVHLEQPEYARPGGPGIGGDDDGVDIDVDEITIGG